MQLFCIYFVRFMLSTFCFSERCERDVCAWHWPLSTFDAHFIYNSFVLNACSQQRIHMHNKQREARTLTPIQIGFPSVPIWTCTSGLSSAIDDVGWLAWNLSRFMHIIFFYYSSFHFVRWLYSITHTRSNSFFIIIFFFGLNIQKKILFFYPHRKCGRWTNGREKESNYEDLINHNQIHRMIIFFLLWSKAG